MIAHRISEFVELLDIGKILPESYAEYRPLLIDGVCFFLEHLPENRLAQLFIRQYHLAANASFADRVLDLLQQCPTLHKLGQIMARDRRLDLVLRLTLQQLEFSSGDLTYANIPDPILQQLKSIREIEISGPPLAEASVAIILPFTWQDSGPDNIKHGVFKLLKLGIAENLHQELDIWEKLGDYLEKRCEYHNLPPLDYRETLDSVCRLLREEVCFEHEQQHLQEAYNFYADDPGIVIPRLLPFCSNEITAMERIHGGKVTDVNLSASGRKRLAGRVIESMIAKPFWDTAENALFHADPHAGNLFCTDEEKLAILDWTLVGRLRKEQRINLMQIVIGGMFHNEVSICRAVESLGREQPDETRLRSLVAAAMREVRQGQFPGFEWSQRLLDKIALANVMGFPENLILFRKALLTLSSVVADTDENTALDRILLMTGVQNFYSEAPARLWADPNSRAFGTHLSNLDLLTLWGTSPNSAAAYCLGVLQDCLSSFATSGSR